MQGSDPFILLCFILKGASAPSFYLGTPIGGYHVQHFGLAVLLIANLRYAANKSDFSSLIHFRINPPFTCTGGFRPLLIDIYIIQMSEKPIIMSNIETR